MSLAAIVLLRTPLNTQTTGILMTLFQKLKSALSSAVAFPFADPEFPGHMPTVTAEDATSPVDCVHQPCEYQPWEHQPCDIDPGNPVTKARLIENALPVPPTYAVVSSVGEVGEAWERIRSLDSFVVKPAGGRVTPPTLALQRAMADGEEFWKTPSGHRMTARQVQGHMVDLVSGTALESEPTSIVIEYRVTNDDMFYQIYPRGLTGIRVIMYDGDPVLAVAHIPTDTAAGRKRRPQGALSAGIDINTGMMSAAYDKKGYLAEHPDTYASIEGVKIKNWSDILAICTRAASAVPEEYLGVDLVIDADRGPMIMAVTARAGGNVENDQGRAFEVAVAAGRDNLNV